METDEDYIATNYKITAYNGNMIYREKLIKNETEIDSIKSASEFIEKQKTDKIDDYFSSTNIDDIKSFVKEKIKEKIKTIDEFDGIDEISALKESYANANTKAKLKSLYLEL